MQCRPLTATTPVFLRTVADKSPHQDARVRARFALARDLKQRNDLIHNLRSTSDEENARAFAATYRIDLEEFLSQDHQQLRTEAERIFQEIAENHGDIPSGFQ